MKRKRIISAMLTMILSFIVALPVYAAQPDYEFDEDTGILVIEKAIEKNQLLTLFHLLFHKIVL